MVYFVSHLQPISLVVHEKKMYYVVYDDFWTKQREMALMCISSLWLIISKCCGKPLWISLMHIGKIIFVCVQCCLSGYHYVCPMCEENTIYSQLKHGKKSCTLGTESSLLIVIIIVEWKSINTPQWWTSIWAGEKY